MFHLPYTIKLSSHNKKGELTIGASKIQVTKLPSKVKYIKVKIK